MNDVPPAEKKPGSRSDALVILDPSHQPSQFGIPLVVSVLISVTGLLLLLAPEMPLIAKLFLIALILLTLRSWGGFAVLVAVQLDLFLREPQRSSTFQGPGGLLLVFLCVALLMFINRNRELLRRAAKRPFNSISTRLVAALKGELVFDSARAVREIPRLLGATVRGIAILAMCTFCARILLRALPGRRSLNTNLLQWFPDDAAAAQNSLLLVAILAMWIVCSEISWRQLTRDQSRLYLRSVFVMIHHADLRMVARRRLKIRYKANQTRNNVTAAAGPGTPKTLGK